MKTHLQKLIPALCVIFLVGFQSEGDYRAFHSRILVVDMHNDVTQRMLAGGDISRRMLHGQSDLVRFREGGVGLQFFSIWVPPEKRSRPYDAQADEQIDSVESFVRRNAGDVGLALKSWDIRDLAKAKKFVVMMGMEGGHPIMDDLAKLEHFYTRGIRYMTLTWNNSTDWASSASDETSPGAKLEHRGLTDFGKRVVRKMDELGIMVDVSHAGEQTFWDVTKTTIRPIIASHSNAWTLCHNRRNLKDDQMKAIARSGGLVCVTFAPWFLDSTFTKKELAMLTRNKARITRYRAGLTGDEFIKDQLVGEYLRKEYGPIRPSLSRVVDHIDYIVRLIGIDHVGIGSDFDGISVTPKGLEDVSCFPNLTRELMKRGYSAMDITKIYGYNFIRVLKIMEPTQ